MTSSGSITNWVNQLQEGDRAAVQQLWQAYFQKLVDKARQQLKGLPQHLADPEELALSAFKSFCLAAEQQRFPKLEDRDDLWQILVMLAHNKAVNLRQYHTRDKRDFRKVQYQAGEEVSIFRHLLESGEPDPQFAAEVAEECQRLLQMLPDEQLRQIAIWKMEGYTNNEIAGLLELAPSTIERRLALIRDCWSNHIFDEEPAGR